jgi:hypothetical protein
MQYRYLLLAMKIGFKHKWMIKSLLREKEKAIAILKENDSFNKEAITSLSDKLNKLMEET